VDRMQRERDIVVYFYKFKEGKFDIKWTIEKKKTEACFSGYLP
jgi:hypothetical protein